MVAKRWCYNNGLLHGYMGKVHNKRTLYDSRWLFVTVALCSLNAMGYYTKQNKPIIKILDEKYVCSALYA